MKGFVGVTDNDWFTFLSHQPGISELYFWQRIYVITGLKKTHRHRRLSDAQKTAPQNLSCRPNHWMQ